MLPEKYNEWTNDMATVPPWREYITSNQSAEE
jgi:hypothetical protein